MRAKTRRLSFRCSRMAERVQSSFRTANLSVSLRAAICWISWRTSASGGRSETEMKGDPADLGFETRAIHVGQAPDPVTGAVTVPIYQTTTFAQHEVGKTYGGYEYARTNNPTRQALEECIASLEGG